MIEEYQGVWVFIEQNAEQVESVSPELLGAGRNWPINWVCRLPVY